MLTFHATGDWQMGQLGASWSQSSRPVIPEVERLIESVWDRVRSEPGVHLFDGPMCRLESWQVFPQMLHLLLSETSYKPFLGTNLHHPELADTYGREILANPVGVSPALESSDGYLIFGRRNSSVAYYPNRIHPFAGALEPGDDRDLFAAVRRELREELGFNERDVADVRCTGIAEDHHLRQPELIFYVRSSRTREQIEAHVDHKEHNASWAIRAEEPAVTESLRKPELTPVAVAALLLWGRARFGPAWFERNRP